MIRWPINNVVDNIRFYRNFVLSGRKISTPYSFDSRMGLFNFFRERNRLPQLRARHNGTPEVFKFSCGQIFFNSMPGVVLAVAINENIFKFTMDGGSHLQDRIWYSITVF